MQPATSRHSPGFPVGVFRPPWAVLLAAGLFAAAPARAVTLFDASLGAPAGQGWITLQSGAAAATGLVGSLYGIDTTGAGVVQFGHARSAPFTLDGASGWVADWRLRIVQEQHSNNDRAGFSLLFVGSPATGSVEIAFREDRVFAYAYQGGAFVQGVGAAVDTTDALHDYRLEVGNQQFSISRDGVKLFDGSLQDYSPQGLPYNLPGFLFFGDNTSSGSAQVELARLAVSLPVPEPASAALLAAGLLALGAWSRRRGAGARPATPAGLRATGRAV